MSATCVYYWGFSCWPLLRSLMPAWREKNPVPIPNSFIGFSSQVV
jgi:hypothetical protein